MKITPEQLQEEEQHLQKTLSVITKIIEDSSHTIELKKDEIHAIKKYLWDNIRVLDPKEISSSMSDVNTSVQNTNYNIESVSSLQNSLLSPYFGRVDFHYDDDDDSAKIYIGINGVIDDHDYYVFDWRTPVASLFYNYGVGDAEYQAPVGTVKGNISLKRQFKIVNGKIERCFDSDLNIDDDYLQEILSNSSSEQMKNIVNTIQKEQNVIIRNQRDPYLIVQGIAGSGKTAVALHRIAYLLYNDKNLDHNNVLIFSPNEIFSQYISNVLPELGEENVLQTTFSDFASSYLSGDIETFTSFIERYYKKGKNDEKNSIKLSDEFKNVIDEAIQTYVSNIHFTGSLFINGNEISMEELDEFFHQKFDHRPFVVRLHSMAEYFSDLYDVSKPLILDKLKTILNTSGNTMILYQKILQDNHLSLDYDKTSITPKGKIQHLSYSDLLPYLYLCFELYGYPVSKRIKHVIIDEAQDYTLLQFDILKKIFTDASFTILGDTNQTINPYYQYDSLEDINQVFQQQGKYVELTKTYRSSQEIIDYTNQILDIHHVCSVRHPNSIPVETGMVSDEDLDKVLVERIHDMQNHSMKRIAIITKSIEEAVDLYSVLKSKLPDLTLVNQADSIIGDLVIIPSYVSKGLEFDGVIVYTSKDNEYQDKDKNLFYVVCSRAQHALSVYNQKVLERKSSYER